jgi:hypothetical protein
MARAGKSYFFQPLEIFPEDRFKFIVPHSKRVELDQQRTIRGVKVADACEGLQLQQPQQLPDSFVRLKGDPMAKIN